MQRVRRFVVFLLTAVNDNSSTRHRLFKFRDAHLADSHGCRNTHHGGRDEVLRGDAQVDVRGQHGARDSGESLADRRPLV